MNEELMKINLELRSLSEKIKDGSIKADEAKTQLDALKAQKREIEQKIALANAPKEERTSSVADIQKAMIEKRAITLNGTGAIIQIKDIHKELTQKREILNNVKYFYGPNAQTNIPILSPSIARPGSFGEGATNVPSDTQAALGVKMITPHAYVSVLPITAEVLTLGSVNFESEITGIFTEAFADGFADQVISGDGLGMNFDGLFNGLVNTIKCNAVGNPKVKDLVELALHMKDFTDDSIIVMNPFIYSGILLDNSTGFSEIGIYKEELIRNKTIEGVKVLLTGKAPSDTTSGSVVAVAYRPSDYGFGLASEISIEPIKKVGDTNTYFQAIMFANGTKILNKNFYGLEAK